MAIAASGCGGDSSGGAAAPARGRVTATCSGVVLSGWQRLADRIGAPVYCPAWMPAPLTGRLGRNVSFGGAGGVSLSVSKDRSYLASFVWAEPGSGEVHVNLRGYPGRTGVPSCLLEDFNRGKITRHRAPCFADRQGTVRERGITATVYTANQDADLWHVLLAWRRAGSLYTVSEHVAEPLTYAKVVANLHRMLRSLVLVEPSA